MNMLRRISVYFSLILIVAFSDRLYAQSFKEISSGYFFADSIVNKHSLWFDMDGNAKPDLFCGNIYNRPNRLYSNEGESMQLYPSVVLSEGGNSYGAAVADIDSDNDLDLFVYNIFGQKNFVYINDGRGNFERKIYTPLNSSDNNSFSASFIDVDGDGDQDIFITDTELWSLKNSKKRPLLFLNDGRGNFTTDTQNDFRSPNLDSRSHAWGDYDNDGDPDLFIGNFGSPNALYKNTGANKFEKVWGIISEKSDDTSFGAWADLDNDGDLDLLVVNVKAANELFLNDGRGNFTRKEDFQLASEKSLSALAGISDLNNDGFLDLIAYGMQEKTKTVFIQESTDKNWLCIKLRSDGTNFQGIGSRVAVKADISGKSIWQYRYVQSGSGKAMINAYDIHFGLGDAQTVDSIRIEWANGKITYLKNIAANRILVAEENGTHYYVPAYLLLRHKESLLKDVDIRIVSDSIRLGTVYTLSLIYGNKSLTAQNIRIELELNNHFKHMQSFPMYKSFGHNRYTWDVGAVPPSGTGVITCSFQIPDDYTLSGTEQTIKAQIFPIAGDENKKDNSDWYVQVIR